jgi:hypothetical protein
MPRHIKPFYRRKAPFSLQRLYKPVNDELPSIPPHKKRGNKPMTFNFEHHLQALIYLHLQEYESGRELLQVLEQDEFAKAHIAPPEGVKKSTFFEAMNTRALEQLAQMYERLHAKTKKILPALHADLGYLVSVDGTLIDAVPTMEFADYREGVKKAKAHLGFNLNHGIPERICLSAGKADERPFVKKIVEPGQTVVADRYYQCHKNFDEYQSEGRHFVIRIKKSTRKTIIEERDVPDESHVFLDIIALLGTKGQNQTEKPVRVVGYRVDGVEYYVATDRFDLTAEQIACIYKLRWDIEKFFSWWKQHLNVYHVIARSPYGLLAQILGGLITYLLLAIYCHEEHNERVSIERVRELRIKIRNELTEMLSEINDGEDTDEYLSATGPPSHASP